MKRSVDPRPGGPAPRPGRTLPPGSLGLALATLAIAGWAASPSMALPEEAQPEGALIRDLAVENGPHDLFVSFALQGAFTPEIREQLESGLPVTFNHYVEVLHRRPAWFDRTRIERVVSTTATYDTLTRQYRLTRRVNGELVETTLSDKGDEMEQFMTRVDRLRICDPADLAGDRSLYLRVKSRVQKRFVFFFIPWNFETSWARIRFAVPGPAAQPSLDPSVP